MKEQLEQNRDRLKSSEDRQLWAGLRSALRAERARELRQHQRRWYDWLILTGAAALLTLILFHTIRRPPEEELVYIPQPHYLTALSMEEIGTEVGGPAQCFAWSAQEQTWSRRPADPVPDAAPRRDEPPLQTQSVKPLDQVVATLQAIDIVGQKRGVATVNDHAVRDPEHAEPQATLAFLSCDPIHMQSTPRVGLNELVVRGGRGGEVVALQGGIVTRNPLKVVPHTSREPVAVIPPVAERHRPVPSYPSGTGGSQPVNDQLADDMFFRHEGVNPFVDPAEDPLSTFALDVDTGSYTITRRFLSEGALPPTDVARVEEFVNYFKKDYAPPQSGDFAFQIDGMPSPFAHADQGNYYLLRVGLRGRPVVPEERTRAQIVLVIDRSGSMAQGDRLEMLKEALGVLVSELHPDDEVGIVVFNRWYEVVRDLRPVGNGEKLWAAIQSIHPAGSTNVGEGLHEGYKMMRRWGKDGWIHRIILCSDGVANVDRTGFAEILEHVRAGSDDITLSTVGIGMGNYNDTFLEQLANAGEGQYAYIDRLDEAVRFFHDDLVGTLQLIARDAKAQIAFDPQQVERYRLLGYENRDVADDDFRDNRVDAGEVGAGHEVTAIYELKLRSNCHSTHLADIRLRYQQAHNDFMVELEETIERSDLCEVFGEAPEDLVLDACVAEFAEILRGSYWAKSNTPAAVLDQLYRLSALTVQKPEVAEFIHLVEKASALYD